MCGRSGSSAEERGATRGDPDRKTQREKRTGDAHLLAEGREEDDELDRVNVVGNDDEVGLLGLDERHDVVEARLDEVGLLGLVEVLLAGSEVSRLGLEARLLLLLGLALVLVGEAEQLRGSVLVEDVRELGDRGGAS